MTKTLTGYLRMYEDESAHYYLELEDQSDNVVIHFSHKEYLPPINKLIALSVHENEDGSFTASNRIPNYSLVIPHE